MWELTTEGGDASFRKLSRAQAVAALSTLLAADLIELAVEPVVNGTPTAEYATLATKDAIELITSDAPWQQGGIFPFAGRPHLLWLRLTEAGKLEVDAGAADDVKQRVARHLRDLPAQQKAVRRLSRLIRDEQARRRSN